MVTYYLTTMSVRVEIPLAHPILLTLPYSVGNGGRNTSLQEKKKKEKKKRRKNPMFVVFPA